jgi:hypothetical protein
MAASGQTPTGRLHVEGQLSGSVDGRPITITADTSGICLAVDSVGSAWRLRRQLPSLRGVLAVLSREQVAVRVRIGGMGEFPVLPTPHWIPQWALRLAGLR